MNKFGLIALTVFVFSYSLYTEACSAISHQDSQNKTWVLKSFDFHSGNGYLFVNQRNVQKRSLTFDFGFGKSWTSNYASITFNQISRDFPYGGMNEAGLNMEILWLNATQYPPITSKTSQINESQLIQYVLDTSSNTTEAIEKIKKIQITPIMATVHYMVCDKTGACATIEYLNKKLVVTNLVAPENKILQNTTYSRELKYMQSNNGATHRESAQSMKSIFNISEIKTEKDFIEKSFENLSLVQQGNFSKWQIVYNLEDKKVWFKTVQNPFIKSVSFSDFELDCRKARDEKIIDLNSNLEGDIASNMENYSWSINKSLLGAFEGVPNWMLSTANIYTNMMHSCDNLDEFDEFSEF